MEEKLSQKNRGTEKQLNMNSGNGESLILPSSQALKNKNQNQKSSPADDNKHPAKGQISEMEGKGSKTAVQTEPKGKSTSPKPFRKSSAPKRPNPRVQEMWKSLEKKTGAPSQPEKLPTK